MSDLTDQIRHDVAVLDLVREHLAGRHDGPEAVADCMACEHDRLTIEVQRVAYEAREWRREAELGRLRIAQLTSTEPPPMVQIRAATTKGGPCERCGQPRNRHVCISCSPTGDEPGPGCINCRHTGWDQTPCPIVAQTEGRT